MPRIRPRSVAPVAVSLIVVVGTALLASCTPPLTLTNLERTVYATSLPRFETWWRGEQAAVQHVSTATIDRWWRTRPDLLDSPAARRGPWDVSTDRCSFAPDTGPSFDFRWACVRHDLAWRNLKRLDAQRGGGIDTHARRVRATDQFLGDMQALCATRAVLQRAACRAVATAYHRAVLLVS